MRQRSNANQTANTTDPDDAAGRLRSHGATWLNLVLALLVAGLCGCDSVKEISLTGKLWDKDVRLYCEPTTHPELALFNAPSQQDILVEYNAISDKSGNVRRVAYFLAAGQARIAAGHAPRFVNSKHYADLSVIPSGATTGTHVLLDAHGQSFTLFRPNQNPATYNLPCYREDHNTATRVALTPLAVTADATVVGVIAAVIVGYALAQGNVNYQP